VSKGQTASLRFRQLLKNAAKATIAGMAE